MIIRVLIGLVTGFLLGLVFAGTGNPTLARIPGLIEPIGTIWTNAIRMTVIPLVVSSLIGGILSAPDPRAIGRIGGRAMLLFAGMIAAASAFTVLLAPFILSSIDLGVSGGSQPGAVTEAVKAPSFSQWLVDLVPVNPIQAAAAGAMLPLIVFTVLFAVAATRTTTEHRNSIRGAALAVSDASLVLVRWILALAPIGVFALSMALAARIGVGAAGAIAYYILMVVVLSLVFLGIMYLVVPRVAKLSIQRFAAAAAPAQAVAMSSRSSLAALPAMIDGAEKKLGASAETTAFLIPLAASVFRVGAAIGIPAGVIFLAYLQGVVLTPAQLLTVALTSSLLTFSVPGIPGGSILIMAPVLMAVGLPASGVGLLLAVDTIPDMFRTTTNVTGHMAAASILSREDR